VQIVDGQQQRRLLRDARGQPVQAVHDGERVLLARRPGVAERRGGQRRGVARQPMAAGAHLGLEQLPHHAPRVATLELGRVRHPDGHAHGSRLRACPHEQAGLADPGGPLYEQRRPGARHGGIDRPGDRSEFPRPVQQRAGGRRSRSHSAKSYGPAAAPSA
jgi:hypothetical protein